MEKKITAELRELIARGSSTAVNGFKNEQEVVDKFNSWRTDDDAKNWLLVMGYEIGKITDVVAVKITGSHKTDVQVEIKVIYDKGKGIENISIKLVSNKKGFNQIDKRWVDTYSELWAIPSGIKKNLKLFTGEIVPEHINKRNKKRMFLDELNDIQKNKIINFFETNKIMVVTDLFRGRGSFQASWFLLYKKKLKIWTLLPMSVVMNYYGNGEVRITKQGSLKIGKIGMQRKGGDNGRPSSTMLQFKIDPCEIVKVQ